MNNDCPNILPIKTPLQDYIYDVNLNTFVPVPQDVFQYAEKRLKNKNGTIEEKRKFDAMMEKGYFSSEHIKRINNPYSNYLPLLLSRNMSQILLQVTQGCNFRCEYCIYTASIDGIQRKHTNKRMDFHTAKHAVDYLWNHSIDSDVVTIGFYGGEPLLEFELIKQVILYTEKKFQGKIVHYAMTTNVSLLSIDKVEFLWKHDVHLVLSLDGPKEIQEKNRIYVGSKKSSYDVAVENLNHIRDKFPEYIKRMNINIVINPMDDLDVVYSVFQDGQVFSGIHALATTINDSTLKIKNCESERFAEQLEYHNFLLLLNELGVKSSRQVYPLSEVIIESAKKKLKNRYSATQSVPYETAPGGMCVPGVYKLFVTVDGKLLTCERTNEPSNAGYLGDLSGGIELDRALKMLNVAKLTERQCQNCWAFRYCTNCISHCDDGKDVNAKLRTMQCQKSRGNVYYTFRIMILLLNKKSLTLYRKESQ